MALRLSMIVLSLVIVCGALQAQLPVNVVMLSDIHLDPFHDPAKLEELRAKPVSAWEAVLGAPSATQAEDFAAIQKACKTKGVDTPPVLFQSSLSAEKAQMPKPLFVTVSGDLMAHKFDCRFHTLAPKASEADYAAFAAKTVAFVAYELHKNFPGAPIYFALGNNDSGCVDYAEDKDSAFLAADGKSFGSVALNAADGAKIAREFSEFGDYSVMLPAPMAYTRLIVLQDIFESKKYTDCSGKAHEDFGDAQVAWLHKQLAAAKLAHEQVWVMAHIPPGIDAYGTLSKGGGCGGAPVMFLGSSALGDTMAEFAGTVKLGLFGHTHMDEMKLLRGSNGMSVPVKLVPSITPVNGNNPAFTVATVDPKAAMLLDYSVYAASNNLGDGTATWSKEYTYSASYGMPDFSAASAKKLMGEFLADKTGSSDVSQKYEQFYFVGDPGVSANLKAQALRVVWPGYACSMTNMDEAGFHACACAAK